jgi:hypothetical protein
LEVKYDIKFPSLVLSSGEPSDASGAAAADVVTIGRWEFRNEERDIGGTDEPRAAISWYLSLACVFGSCCVVLCRAITLGLLTERD